MAAPPRKSNRELPAKEASFFKQILRQYEHKQYKKGLKATEQILKKFPDHGESLALKGLFLSHMETGKEQSYDYVKKGLRYDLSSPICWHVYGLLYRSDKNYEEAVKCYRHALKYDKENVQVLRDFSFLQMQMRDYHGYNETTHELLRLRPNQRNYWIGLALSYHLLGRHEVALKVIDAYEETAKEQDANAPIDFEHSELLLYKNTIMQEVGEHARALEHLSSIGPRVCDKRALREYRATLLVQTDKTQESLEAYTSLLAENPESLDYLHGYARSHGLDPESKEQTERDGIAALIVKLMKSYPKSHMLERAALDYSSGQLFTQLMDAYLRKMFRKGVPSVFANVKTLLSASADKMAATEATVTGYITNLRSHGQLASSADGNATSDCQEDPATILWALYFLAQLQDKQGLYPAALATIEEAVKHTPTLLELHVFKARIYKHMGNAKMAAACVDEARKMDLQDRFVNTKSTKYHLRNDCVSIAESTISLFTRQGDYTERMADLVEMQCMWFALESGESWRRQKQYGKALKRFHQVEKHFEDIIDDQFDFHTYCLRKATMRSYVALLRHEDSLQEHRYYERAAQNAVQCYIVLHDNRVRGLDASGETVVELTAEQKKKLASKQRRAAAQAAVAAGGQQGSGDKGSAAAGGGTNANKKPKDDDPDGAKYLEAQDYMAVASEFVSPLLSRAPNRLSTHLLSFEVCIRQNRVLPAYRAVYHATRVATASDPSVHGITLRFWHKYVSEWRDTCADVTRQLIEQPGADNEPLLVALPGTELDLTTLKTVNRAYLQAAKTSGKTLGVLEAVKGDCVLQRTVSEESLSTVTSLAKDGLTLAEALEIDDWLQTVFLQPGMDKSAVKASMEQFHTKCRQIFPHANRFMTETDLAAVDLQLLSLAESSADAAEETDVVA